MQLNTDWKYLQFFISMDLKRPLNSPKNKIIKIEEKLNETVKHCPEQNLNNLLSRKVLYDLLLGVWAIERSVVDGNVSWDLKMMSTIERGPL